MTELYAAQGGYSQTPGTAGYGSTHYAPAAPVPEQVGQVFNLAFSDGRVVTLTGSALVGRNPVPVEGEYFDQIIMVSDPVLSVSKTHLAVAISDGVVWVADRYSTNGTRVDYPDGTQMACEPGQWVQVPLGCAVVFGDRWFTVSQSAG